MAEFKCKDFWPNEQNAKQYMCVCVCVCVNINSLIATYMFYFIKIQTVRESPRFKNMADEKLKQV